MDEIIAPYLVLRIVDSVRIDWGPAKDYAARLHRESRSDPRCRFIEGHLSDEHFDMWILASDYVIVPYHQIWSSGVAARAELHDRPVIASEAGGLAGSLSKGSFRFGTDEELVEILRGIAKP